jgi:hypothetical protein
MIAKARIVLGWLFVAATLVLMWKQPETLLFVISWVVALLLEGRIFGMRPVASLSEEHHSEGIVIFSLASIPFLIGALTGHT